MAERPEESGGSDHGARRAPRADDLADEVERARTPRTPLLALTGVWLTIAVVFLLILAAVMLTLYFVYGDS